MAFSVGETVGPYRIVEQVGQGGMATVYKAYHAALDRCVAIKVIHPALLQDPSLLARFQREARLVAKLDHPNIVPIYDYAEQDGRPYLVMKFIEGETLKARLAQSQIDADGITHITEAVGAALTYAHKHCILHRDIKPSNVLLASDGQIYLADFGLARIARSGDSTLTSDMFLGTPQYISPEQALGNKKLDEGTDIYSFGVMLYEIIVGKVPFSSDTPFSIIHDHIYTPLPLPRQVNPNVSESIELVLLKALAKESQDRYMDVDSMVKAFQQAWQEKARSEGTSGLNIESTVTLASASSPTDATIPPGIVPAPIPPVKSNASIEEVVRSPAILQPDITGASVREQKHKRGWMWLAVSIVIILGCLVTIYGFLPVRQQVILVVRAIYQTIGSHLHFRTLNPIPGSLQTI